MLTVPINSFIVYYFTYVLMHQTDKVTPGEDKQKKKMADLKVEAAAYDGKLLYLSEQLNACHDKLDAKLDDVEDGAKLDGGDVDMGVKVSA